MNTQIITNTFRTFLHSLEDGWVNLHDALDRVDFVGEVGVFL